MKFSKFLICVVSLSFLATSTVEAAEFRSALTRIQPSYSVSKDPVRAPLEFKQTFNTCQSEGFECADGYSCELIMTLSGENSRGDRVNTSGTNQRFYSCNISGSTHIPTCSKGLTPTGRFIDGLGRDLRRIPGGVRTYTCQIAL